MGEGTFLEIATEKNYAKPTEKVKSLRTVDSNIETDLSEGPRALASNQLQTISVLIAGLLFLFELFFFWLKLSSNYNEYRTSDIAAAGTTSLVMKWPRFEPITSPRRRRADALRVKTT